MKNLLKQITAAVCALLFFATSTVATYAAFPGQNGKIAYSELDIDFESSSFTAHISDIDLSGANQRHLMSGVWGGNMDTYTRAPRYSADGSRITYTHESGSYELDIYTMNSDGTDKINVTNINFEETNRFATYSSFHPSGNQLAYGEIWYSENLWHGDIFKINEDGTGKQQLTATNPDQCNIYPVFSPDGSKIAFYRGDRITDTGGIYTMNTDGTDVQQVIQTVSSSSCWFISIAMGSMGDAGYVSSFDWSPDGERIVYIDASTDEEGALTSSLRIVDLEGNFQVLQEKQAGTVVADTLPTESLSSAQFTPDGDIIFKETTLAVDEEAADGFTVSVAVKLMNIATGDVEVVATATETGEGEMALYALVFGMFQLPSVQPVHNIATLSGVITNAPVHIATPVGTVITCSDSIGWLTQAAQDQAYNYPLGLIDFCFDTTEADNQVTLTFVTDLKPSDVIARKYNSTHSTYFDIEDAVITETTYNNQPALQLSYVIQDNGPLDLDPEIGKVRDPVGLAVVAGSAVDITDGAAAGQSLAGTGTSLPLVVAMIVALLGVGGSAAVLTRKRL